MFSNIKALFGFIHVHREFNCGYATHFFFNKIMKSYNQNMKVLPIIIMEKNVK
jgi:hypothetical protein